ncbi:hypothetical protein KMW28_06115 [Flammeovirga yaeyamensis]|uniref:Uncharacterized protein n=1 Tax=Flammeovirga yaeyamensis TaxID=367791 RepID=A0AAX1N7G0_9BACT|nr:hypothetical protein [Flammeovirga yaeyamensis]MBB3697746.1 hypothetical protein [Flammeovirga yaeyamensis]NMF35898.1 hypothetical protein [Flammeovirga yaeyamensis]QWG03152.1 hypothetical protein KMW28_06115 [Flammeovirga yaeyamensis]
MITSQQAEEKLQSLKASKEAAQLIWNSFEEGGVTIHTPFTLNGKPYAFSTLIQLDADVINYFPNISDADFNLYSRKLENVSKRHWYEVEFAFYKLGSSRQLWYLLSDIILWGSNAIALLSLMDFENILTTLYWLLLPVLSGVVRKKVLKVVAPKLLRFAFNIKKFVERILKKKENKKKEKAIYS